MNFDQFYQLNYNIYKIVLIIEFFGLSYLTPSPSVFNILGSNLDDLQIPYDELERLGQRRRGVPICSRGGDEVPTTISIRPLHPTMSPGVSCPEVTCQ